jgi:hypothetical protein
MAHNDLEIFARSVFQDLRRGFLTIKLKVFYEKLLRSYFLRPIFVLKKRQQIDRVNFMVY